MKLTVALPDLQKALQKVLPAVPAKSPMPVLEHVQLSLAGSELTLRATDQEISISLTIPVSGEQDGEILVPAKQFNDLIKELGTAGVVAINVDHAQWIITIRTPTGSYEMKGLDAGEFPPIPEFPPSTKAFVSKDDMVKMANKTVFAVSREDYRPSMTGVYFQFEADTATAVATDGFRLSRVIVNASEDKPFPAGLGMIVPSRTVELLRKADADVAVDVCPTHARFVVGTLEITTRLIDEKYPPYQNVIPTDNDKILRVSQREVLAAIRRVALFANTNTRQVRFKIEDKNLTIHSHDEDAGSKATETVPCEFSSDDFELGFNYHYLEDAIKNISSDHDSDGQVVMTFSTPIRAVLVKPGHETESLLMLVMPVKI